MRPAWQRISNIHRGDFSAAIAPVAVISMSIHYDAMRTAVVIFTGIVLLSGCAGKSTRATVAAGCYRFDDGTPFFRITGRTGTFVEKSNLKSFEIGSWRSEGREVEVTPAFILHDGTDSTPGGPARMAEAVTTLSSGVIRYKQANDRIILSIPIEAYGWEDVRLGKPC
jgi:hypothetical protein